MLASEAVGGVFKCIGGWGVRREASHCLFKQLLKLLSLE